MRPRILWWLLLLLLVLASLATLGMLFHTSGVKFGHARALYGSDLWALSPYGGLALLACGAGRHRPALWTSFVGAIILIAFGLIAYIDGFFFHLDAQNGLLFLFVPLYQWAGTLVLSCVAGLVALFRKNR